MQLLLAALVWIHLSNASKRLLMVNLVYRHGARSPIHFYPNDKYQEKDWPDGAGRLTLKGMKMEYDLGIFLKERYILKRKFVNPPYKHRDIYIRSSDVERCLQSAETQLAGFYPPNGTQIWNPAILWQPVPVHTIPKTEDSLLRSTDNSCPRREELWNELRKTSVYKEKIANSTTLVDKVSKYAGVKLDFDNFWQISDTITCEITEGLEVPDWVNKLHAEIKALEDWIFVYFYRGNDELGKVLGGPLLSKITKNMKAAIKNESKDFYKMNIFSGHDTSLLSLSAALDIDITVPIFASCLIIELYHSVEDGFTVEMYYRNTESGHLQPLKLKKCNYSCPFTKFVKLTNGRASVDWKKECRCDQNHGFFDHLEIMSLVFFILAVVALVAVIIVIVWKKSILFHRYSRTYDDTVEDDDTSKERLI